MFHSFSILVKTVEDVRAFAEIAVVQPFDITVGYGDQQINGKSIMGYFCLDPMSPMEVTMRCSDDEYNSFYHAAERFRTN